jgi:ComF family protein
MQICPICAKPSIDGFTHPRCRTSFGLGGMYAACHYKGPIKDAIHLLKYRFVSDLVDSLTDVYIKYYPKNLYKLDCLVPVPLHKKREKERGFNQSVLLAKSLSKKLNLPVLNILIRTRYTKPQVDLTGKDRRSNLQNVFLPLADAKVREKSIGLVDDVATTRTTLLECAKVLKKQGAESVIGLVLAHG